ncbi:hypothetical protein ACY2GS_002793 [Enterobacter asburiae]
MAELTKQWLQQKIADMEAARDEIPFGLDEDDSNTLAALRIALASLEAEPVAWLLSGGGAKNNVSFDSGNAYADPLREVTPLYTAPPAPVSVPAAMEMDDDFDSAFEHGKAVGWNAYRAAMLQGADGTLTNEGTIPVTQFKPVADLYGLTSPTGGETSFTFDAVEARDFIDGGWSCQEYVELVRFQEAMLQGAEPVTTAYKLPPHIFRELVNRLRDTAVKYQGCQQLREQLSRTLQEVIQPAEPQQEVTQALAKGMERYGDAMQKLADSGD